VNREQFLKQLGANLGKLTSAERSEILSDIDEFFVFAAKEGQTEAAIVARLGDPRKLAKEYVAQSRIESANQSRTPKNMLLAFLYAAGLGTVNALYAVFVVGVGYIVIGALYLAAVCIGIGGVAAVGTAAVRLAGSATAIALGVVAGVALISISVLFFIGIMSLSKAFHRGNMAFLNNISDRIKEAGARK